MKHRLIPVCALAVVTFAEAAATLPHFDGNSWWAHVKVLAADNMEGRETGSSGLKRAQEYVISELKAAGVKPAGVDGFYQPVKLVSRTLDESASSAALVRSGEVHPLTQGVEGYYSTRVDLAPNIDAPLVFVGYGLHIPEAHYDDLAGLDLHGKIAVYINAAPAGISPELSAHSRSQSVRWEALRAAGAIGTIGILNPASMDIPWPRIAANRNHPTMTLADPAFDESRGMQLSFAFNPEHADLLFEGSGHTWQQILDSLHQHKQLARFPLNASFKGTTKLLKTPVESANLVAKLEGSDPKMRGQYVVLSAHLDHVGIGEPVNGDRIYNGAMDNSSGSSALIDIASAINKAGVKPKRSLLFVFVTGEEKGELGSRYFAAKPTVDKKAIVADINIDMFLPLVPLKTVTAYGLKESTLGDTLQSVARAQGLNVQPDPQPQRSVFTRSDQYSFVKEGIPGIMVDVAFPGEEAKIEEEWLKNRYHAPSDDLNQPVNKATAGKYEDVVGAFMLAVADANERPAWKPDSFFRRFATE